MRHHVTGRQVTTVEQELHSWFFVFFLISEASSFHLQEPVWPLSEASRVSSFMIDLKEYGVSLGSLCPPRGDSSQAGEDMEMGGLVSFCCITNYLETQWLKLAQFIISR